VRRDADRNEGRRKMCPTSTRSERHREVLVDG
jgi:hypothetical protein